MTRFALTLFLSLLFFFSLTGCGQRSSLFIPSEEEARNRASLPQILIPATPSPASKEKAPTSFLDLKPSNTAPPPSQTNSAPK